MDRITITAIILSILVPLSATAQERSAEPTPTASPAIAALVPSSLTGIWRGSWEGKESKYHGQMEIEVVEDGDHVTGRVKATYSIPGTCSVAWERLAGVKTGEKVLAQYDLRGRCGKVDTIFSIDPADRVLAGTYKNQYGAEGSFRLMKQNGPVVSPR